MKNSTRSATATDRETEVPTDPGADPETHAAAESETTTRATGAAAPASTTGTQGATPLEPATGEEPTTGQQTTTEPEAAIPPPSIRVTEAALQAIREMIAEEELPEEGGLRLSARTGAGCSAPLQYGMVLETAPDADDQVLESRGVRIFMDPESAWVLDGLLVDYVTSSPMGEGFAFRHPRRSGGRAC